MAMTADLAHSRNSPRAGDGVNSPGKSKNWSKVVRGNLESIPAVNQSSAEQSCSPDKAVLSSRPASSEQSSSPSKVVAASVSLRLAADNGVETESLEANAAAKGKRAAWNKPSNDVAEVSPVMGAISWPALSESTKASPKSSQAESSSSLKIVSDGSMPSSQGPVPVIPHSPHKQPTSNAKPNSTSNHTMPARQRSMKRGGGGGSNPGGGHSHNSFAHPPPPPPPPPTFPVFAMPPNGYSNLVPTMPDQSPREPLNRGNNWEPRAAGGFVVSDHRHSSRRGNFGPRGDGPYHNNFGGRRDQDRGHYGNVRDVHVQPQRAPPRGFVRPPPLNTATFVPPQQVRPFANPMGFPDFVYVPALPLETFRGVPFITHAPAPAMLMHVPEPPLPAMLLHQIEYYFSDANLVKDNFLKLNMDDQGWVAIALIAGFNRVKNMTNDIQLILESLRTSSVLEVQDDKVRRRNDWVKWIPSSTRLPTNSGLQSPSASSYNTLTTSFQKITVEETAANKNGVTVESSPNTEDVPRRHSSELMAHAQMSRREGTEDTSSS